MPPSTAERGRVRPTPPRTALGLAEETTGAGRGQNTERQQAQDEPRQFAPQIRVSPGQHAEHDQDGPQAESDRGGRAQHDSDQNRERTHIFRLVYTWLAAWARLALSWIGAVILQENGS